MRIFGLIMAILLLCAGTWTEGGFLYKPDLGAKGPEEKAKFDAGIDRVDARLGQRKTLGDPGYGSLAEAIATIGAEGTTLFIPAGTVNVAENLTIPVNVHLKVLRGGILQVDEGVTLTIAGSIEAGIYQIFDLTAGQLDLSQAKAGFVHTDWWGPGAGLTDVQASGLPTALVGDALLDALYFRAGGAQFSMQQAGDFLVPGGVILTNPDGTITKRVRLNEEGDALIFEAVE